MLHLDLFSGIGGFAYAIDQVWEKVEHIFFETDPFCRAVLIKHWSRSVINGDIKEFIANAERVRKLQPQGSQQNERGRSCDLLTAGVPCQPASCAGQRRGSEDERWLWPETFEIIRITKPTWVVLENVRGLITLGRGMVFDSLLFEMESIGYEVQPFIIPACAVNAPHRRDRVWIIANRKGGKSGEQAEQEGREDSCRGNSIITDTKGTKQLRFRTEQNRKQGGFTNKNWEQDWRKVAFATCDGRMDDGLPARMDGLELSKSKHRRERLKSLGNSIVPQVMVEIFKAIKQTEATARQSGWAKKEGSDGYKDR